MRITVVGAGVVGCAIAHELASRGAHVRLVDPRGIGRGATRASAGILAPQIEGHIPQLRSLASRSLAMYDDFVSRVARDSGRSIEFRRNGTLQVALDDAQAAVLSQDAGMLADNSVECTLLDRAAAMRLEPSLTGAVTGALLVPMHGYVHAASLTDALADAARARGARITAAAVQSVESGAHGPVVSVPGHTIASDAIVVASGSWRVPSRPAEAPSITPIRGQLVHLRSEAPCVARVLWGDRCYIVPWLDGSLLVGATVEDVGFDERCTAEGVRGLLSAAIDLVPSIAGAHLQEVRVGLRPKAVDELPIIGASESMPGVFYAVGHYRNGVLLAPLTAALVADLVLGGREHPELALVSPGRVADA